MSFGEGFREVLSGNDGRIKNPDPFMERGKMQHLNISKASVRGF